MGKSVKAKLCVSESMRKVVGMVVVADEEDMAFYGDGL